MPNGTPETGGVADEGREDSPHTAAAAGESLSATAAKQMGQVETPAAANTESYLLTEVNASGSGIGTLETNITGPVRR